MTPQEIQEVQRTYPVGRVLDLSGKTVQVLLKLTEMRDGLTFLQENIIQRMGGKEMLAMQTEEDDDAAKERVKGHYDALMTENPLQAMICQELGGFGAQGPMADMFASQNREIMNRMRWCLVYEDLVNHYGMTADVWRVLTMETMDSPRCGGVIVTGYSFNPKDITPQAGAGADTEEDLSVQNFRRMMGDDS